MTENLEQGQSSPKSVQLPSKLSAFDSLPGAEFLPGPWDQAAAGWKQAAGRT